MNGKKGPIIYLLLVENKPGVLFRVASQFRRRHFNIESIAVGITERRDTSRMTVMMYGDDQMADDFARILRRTVDVLSVDRLRPEDAVKRELALVRVKGRGAELLSGLLDDGRARVLHEGDSYVIQLVGEPGDIDELVEKLDEEKVLEEVVRTGVVAICRR